MNTQKTYRGHTAGGWLRIAHVERMQAGNYEVVIDGMTCKLADNGNLILAVTGEPVAHLLCSDTAADKLIALTKAADIATMRSAWADGLDDGHIKHTDEASTLAAQARRVACEQIARINGHQ